MPRTNLIGLLGVWAVVTVAVMPSCTSTDDRMPEGGVEFNSKLALRVWVFEKTGGLRPIGADRRGGPG